jgi:hypothetical protein
MTNEWIEWGGGECPVAGDVEVEIQLGDDWPEFARGRADLYGWCHEGYKALDAHIAAYRVVQS